MVMYKEFKIDDLFDKLDLKRLKPTFDKKSDLSKVQTEEFDLPLVNAKAGNNGIMYYGRSGDWESETMTIDIVNDGAVSAGMVYAQPQATGTLYNAYQIKVKSDVFSDLTVPHLLFLATVIQKSIQHKYNYSNKAVWSKVSSELIQLPVKQGTDDVNYSEADIDWDYMEQFIKEIECSQISKIDVYLQETGLDNTRLTEEEQTLLSAEPTFGEFKVGDLFDVEQGRRLKKSDFQDGDIPFVMASSKNNGVVAYLSNPVTTNTNFITVDILGNVFYQDGLVGYGDDNCGLKLKNGHQSEAVYLYLTTVISKFKPMASYGNKLRGKWYTEQLIQLPLKPGTDVNHTSEDDIDWDYMEAYIRAMEKQVIANTVTYKDTLIAKTKELVN